MFADSKDKLFCEIGLDLGYLGQSQISQALDAQRVDRAMGITKPIGSYLFEEKILTREQISQIVKMQDKIRTTQQDSVQSGDIQRPVYSGGVQQSSPRSADTVSVVVWFFLCFPLGFTQWNQTGKGWVWLLICAITQGLGTIVMVVDYWMSYSAQRNRTLGPWEWFPH